MLENDSSGIQNQPTMVGVLGRGILVSVVVPVYNDSDTIEKCLSSLALQDYGKIEILVVNDGSTDETPRIIGGLASRDPRIRVIDIKHSGTSKAKNVGFKNAQGDVIFFGEGDAIYSEDYVKKSVECLAKDRAIGAVCVLGSTWAERPTFVTRSINAENHIKHHLIHEGIMKPYFAWVFSRQVLEEVGLYDSILKQAEDRDLFRRVQNAGYKIGLVEGVHWRHRREETIGEFARKSYAKGKRRIPYLAKWNRKSDFLRSVSVPWGVLLLSGLSIIIPSMSWALLGTIGLGLIYMYYRILSIGLRTPARRLDLLLLPVYQIVRHVSNAAGYTVGLFSYAYSRLIERPLSSEKE